MCGCYFFFFLLFLILKARSCLLLSYVGLQCHFREQRTELVCCTLSSEYTLFLTFNASLFAVNFDAHLNLLM